MALEKEDDKDKKDPEMVDRDLPEIEQELSKVAVNPKQNLLILVVIAAVFVYVFFNFFFKEDENDVKIEENTVVPGTITKPAQANKEESLLIPTIPSAPELEEPTGPSAPLLPPLASLAHETPPPLQVHPLELPASIAEPEKQTRQAPQIGAPGLPSLGTNEDEDEKKKKQSRRKSSVMLVAGVVPTKTPEQIQEEQDFKYRGDMEFAISRGKLIEVIIESAINTDFGGEVRAVVSRDVYSEWGRNILIHKGSRVYGNYSTGINGAYGRVSIIWERIDLANGYTLNITSPAVDNLSRPGVQGRLDDKFKERFSNAVLKSAFDIALAKTLDTIITPQLPTQDAANSTSVASAVRNAATIIFTEAGKTDAQKRADICTSSLAAITDKTVKAYTTINDTCNTLNAATTGTDAEKLASLMASINAAADDLLNTTTQKIVETKSQAASKQAFTDLSQLVKDYASAQNFTPNITINQGTKVKIYVSRDYVFPKLAVKSRKR